jgi:5-(carboxyamino)imidazole ribonucleotide mutase
MKKPLVAILMGSESDLPVMEKATEVLKEMGVPYEVEISSAHRLPEKTANYARRARKRGIEVLIAGAGLAAHLAGVLASHSRSLVSQLNPVLWKGSMPCIPPFKCLPESRWLR